MASIFLDFNLPNAATWFYFSLLLAMALFFKFTRLLSVRNWDLVTLFLLVPGFLLIVDGRERLSQGRDLAQLAAAAYATPLTEPGATLLPAATDAAARRMLVAGDRLVWSGYLWLLCGSSYWLVRCLFDLALERRPLLPPNLNLPGLAWMAATLAVCLATVAARRAALEEVPVGPPSAVVEEAAKRATDLLQQAQPEQSRSAVRFWVGRSLAGACHLSLVIGFIVIGARHYGDVTAGMSAATLYLLLPYISFHVGQVHHALPAALLVWAVVYYRVPCVSGALLGLAAGMFLFPALVLPVWVSFYWRRGARPFLRWFALAAGWGLALTGFVLWYNGQQVAAHFTLPLGLPDWRVWRVADAESFWAGVHWAYRIPVFVVAMALLIVTSFWPMPKNLAHLLALTAANLIGVQLWYADHGGMYVLWYLPLVLLLVFRPNLSDRLPPLVGTAEVEPSSVRQKLPAAAGRSLWPRRALRG